MMHIAIQEALNGSRSTGWNRSATNNIEPDNGRHAYTGQRQRSRRASHAFGGGNLRTEYPAVADDRLARSRQRKGLPERHLVRPQDRAIDIFLPRLHASDRAKAVAADEDVLGAVWRLRPAYLKASAA